MNAAGSPFDSQWMHFVYALLPALLISVVSFALFFWRRNPFSFLLMLLSGFAIVVGLITARYVFALLFYGVNIPEFIDIVSNAIVYPFWIGIPLLWIGHLLWILTHRNTPTIEVS